jgi:hypothetical protein
VKAPINAQGFTAVRQIAVQGRDIGVNLQVQ